MDDPVSARLCALQAYRAAGARNLVVIPRHQPRGLADFNLLVRAGDLENRTLDRRRQADRPDD